MDLAEALLEVGPGRADASFALFAQTLDPQWIDAALRATGAASVRRRKLPAEYVVWLIIGMGLLRDRSIEEVVPTSIWSCPASIPRAAARPSPAAPSSRPGIASATSRSKPCSPPRPTRPPRTRA